MTVGGAAALFPALAGIFGLLVGSFLNVVIHRTATGESIVFPPSKCPRCGHRLAPWENIPVFSWLALRGRCSACRAPIAVRYPLVESMTGALFALSFLEFGATPMALGACALSAVLVAVLFFDLEHLLLPDVLVLPCALAGLAVALAGHRLVAGIEGALVAGGVIYIIYALTRGRGMGFGDVKLAAAIGFALDAASGAAFVAAAFVIGALAALPVLAARTRGGRDALPFGPFLVAAAYLMLFAPQSAFGPFEAYRQWIASRGGL